MVLRECWIIKSVKMKDRPITGEEIVKRGFKPTPRFDSFIYNYPNNMGLSIVRILGSRSWSIGINEIRPKKGEVLYTLEGLDDYLERIEKEFTVSRWLEEDYLLRFGLHIVGNSYVWGSEFGTSLEIRPETTKGHQYFICTLDEFGTVIERKRVDTIPEFLKFLDDNDLSEILKFEWR